MSIKRMTDVWDKSTHTSSDLLLLLALADTANEDGHCWPGIDYLCKKTRLSESTVIRRTRALEKSGELVVKRNRRHGNKYLVVTGFTPEQIEALTKQYFGEKFLTVKLQDTSNLQNDSSELASYDSSELAPVTDDPSLTVNEPSKESVAEKTPDHPTLLKQRDPIYDAVAVAWHIDPKAGASIGRLKAYLEGKPPAREKNFQDCGIEPPATPEQILAFGKWWTKHFKGADMPQRADKLQERWYEFMKSYTRQQAINDTPAALQFDPDAVFDITPRVYRPQPAGVSA